MLHVKANDSIHTGVAAAVLKCARGGGTEFSVGSQQSAFRERLVWDCLGTGGAVRAVNLL